MSNCPLPNCGVGGLGERTARALHSGGLADLSKPGILADLRSRFPKRGTSYLPAVGEFEPFDPVQVDMRRHLSALENGRATSLGGCQHEYLTVLARNFSDPLASQAIEGAQFLAERILAGALPPWYHQVLAAAILVPLDKEGKAVRPIAVGDAFRNAAWSCAVQTLKGPINKECWPHAIGSGATGVAALEFHSVRELLDLHPDWVAGSDDIRNCHSEIRRAQVAPALDGIAGVRNLIPGLTADMLPKHSIWVQGADGGFEPLADENGDTIAIEDGLQQGHAPSSMACSLVLLPHTRAADARLAPLGGRTRGYQDDHRHVGPMQPTLEAAEAFANDIRRGAGLEMNPTKRRWYSPDPAVRGQLRDAGVPLGIVRPDGSPIKPTDVDYAAPPPGSGYGIVVMGAPVGDDN